HRDQSVSAAARQDALTRRPRGSSFSHELFAPSPAKAGEGWGGVPLGSSRTVSTPSQPPPAVAGGGATAEARGCRRSYESGPVVLIAVRVAAPALPTRGRAAPAAHQPRDAGCRPESCRGRRRSVRAG